MLQVCSRILLLPLSSLLLLTLWVLVLMRLVSEELHRDVRLSTCGFATEVLMLLPQTCTAALESPACVGHVDSTIAQKSEVYADRHAHVLRKATTNASHRYTHIHDR